MAQQLPQIHSVHSSQRRPAHGSARPAAPSLLARVPWGFLAVIAALVAYALLVLVPTAIDAKEAIAWRCSLSAI